MPAPRFNNRPKMAHGSMADAWTLIYSLFLKTSPNMYDNLGVLPNAPSFDWHLNNMSNYINHVLYITL